MWRCGPVPVLSLSHRCGVDLPLQSYLCVRRCTTTSVAAAQGLSSHPEGNPGANLKSISHRCHPILVAFVWELTNEVFHLPLGCLQGGLQLVEPQLGGRWQGSGCLLGGACWSSSCSCASPWCAVPSTAARVLSPKP